MNERKPTYCPDPSFKRLDNLSRGEYGVAYTTKGNRLGGVFVLKVIPTRQPGNPVVEVGGGRSLGGGTAVKTELYRGR